MKRRHLLQQGSLVLLLGASELARGASIVAVRVWPAAEYTRVTIESDRLLKATPRFVANPPRLAVDIEDLELQAALRDLVSKVRADDPLISGVRVGQFAPGVVRLVLDLKQAAAPQVFNLRPVAAYGHRLVLDLYPQQEVDPLDALIAQQVHPTPQPNPLPTGRTVPTGPASAAPAGSPPDALGELIAKRTQGPTVPAGSSAGPSIGPAGGTPGGSATLPPAGTLPLPTPAQVPAQASPPVPSVAPASAPFPSAPAAVPAASASAQAASSPGPAPWTRSTERMVVVALDPGHGGEDPGAIGQGGTREKDVVLHIAHRVRDKLQAHSDPQHGQLIRAYLTRDADFFVPLQQRVQKARRVQADLFVSLHADAFITPSARGASVFALSERGASSSSARWLAHKENQADLVGGLNVRAQDMQVQQALLDMSTTAQIKDSLILGHAMLGEMGRIGQIHKKQVEQASFAVLKAPDIPSVLVETAFISNPEEEERLRSEAYQDQVAQAIVRGILRYFRKNPPLARVRNA